MALGPFDRRIYHYPIWGKGRGPHGIHRSLHFGPGCTDPTAEADPGTRNTEKGDDQPIEHVFQIMSPALRSLLASDILVRFAEQIPYAFAVIWAMKYVGYHLHFNSGF